MISIEKPVPDLDQCARLKDAAASSFAMAIGDTAAYALEWDADRAGEFRQHLTALKESVDTASQPEQYHAVQSSFRGELRLYRDDAQEWLLGVQHKMEAAAEAMQAVSESLSDRGMDHEQRLKDDLQTLHTAAGGQDPGQMRAAIEAAAADIAENCQQMMRANRSLIVQLKDEIRSLHREMASERRALHIDRVSGAWNRQKMESRIEELLQRGDAFSIVIAWVKNIQRLEGGSALDLIEGVLKALVKRANGVAGEDSMIGRWNQDEFIVIMEADPVATSSVGAELAKQLSGPYVIQDHGRAHQLTLHVATVVVERLAGTDPQKFSKRLEQTGTTLRSL